MKLVYSLAVELLSSRAAHGSAAARSLGADMCKELKTKVLRLLPPTSNGPAVNHTPPPSNGSATNHTPPTSNGSAVDHAESRTDGAEILSCTVNALKEGGVVAVPTDTIYGLACLAQNSEAVRKTYDIKGRDAQKPLAICVGEIQDIYKYCKVPVKEALLGDLLPGPVTLVFERAETLNADLNPFTTLVGVRIPDHAFMRRLCQMCGEPLALTSANVSSHTSTVEAHEFQELWPKLAVVVDGGPIGDQCRLGSTVVDLSVRGKYRIIRPGCALSATLDMLEHKYGLSEDSG